MLPTHKKSSTCVEKKSTLNPCLFPRKLLGSQHFLKNVHVTNNLTVISMCVANIGTYQPWVNSAGHFTALLAKPSDCCVFWICSHFLKNWIWFRVFWQNITIFQSPPCWNKISDTIVHSVVQALQAEQNSDPYKKSRLFINLQQPLLNDTGSAVIFISWGRL